MEYTEAVQKAIDDALKSCHRELSTVIALGTFNETPRRNSSTELTSTPLASISAAATAISATSGLFEALATSQVSPADSF